MRSNELNRRHFLAATASTALAACGVPALCPNTVVGASEPTGRGSQRLSIEQLHRWESLRYGMFIHFGMATMLGVDFTAGNEPATTFAPDRLDVDQWVSVARDAGMRYAVLTAKHVTGHCLWPSRHTDYTVANSTNKTNVVEAFCKSCEKQGVLPGLYYNATCDNHHRFGSKTIFEGKLFPARKNDAKLPPFTTSLYQTFMTAQVTELLTQFGPIAETWIDMPGPLGRGYRKFLYDEIARLQPQTVIIYNAHRFVRPYRFNVDYAWPSDVSTLEFCGNYHGVQPSPFEPAKWQEIEGKQYYMPGELCDVIGQYWFARDVDKTRSDEALLTEFDGCRAAGVNLLLNVPPKKNGLISDDMVTALMRLRKNARI